MDPPTGVRGPQGGSALTGQHGGVLKLSTDAARLIRQLLEASDLSGGGLRIGTCDVRRSLVMELTSGARAGDLTVQQDAAALFLSPLAAARLDNAVLQADMAGRRAFYLGGRAN